MGSDIEPLITSEVYYLRDPIKAALGFLFGNGENQVLYDTCELVWQSADLLSKPVTNENQMAVFGIRGIFQIFAAARYRFQFQFMTEHLEQPSYWVRVAIQGPIDGYPEDHSVDLFRTDTQSNQEFFEDAIQQLTDSVQILGVEGAICLFLMSWTFIDANLE